MQVNGETHRPRLHSPGQGRPRTGGHPVHLPVVHALERGDWNEASRKLGLELAPSGTWCVRPWSRRSGCPRSRPAFGS